MLLNVIVRNCKTIHYLNNKLIKPNILRNASSKLNLRKTDKTIGPFGWVLLIVPASSFLLGTWQVKRKKWKEDLIAELHARVNTNPIQLPHSLDEISQLEYYPVYVRGRFLHEKEIHLGPRSFMVDGDASSDSSLMSNLQTPGYLVVTPLKLKDRDETILVNRGWVPFKNKDPKTRLKGQVEDEVDVIGVIRLHEKKPNFMPTNNPETNMWLYRDLNEMSKVANTEPIFIDATTEFNVPAGPIGGQTRVGLRNEHLHYILTWYSLCAITSYMWYAQFIKGK